MTPKVGRSCQVIIIIIIFSFGLVEMWVFLATDLEKEKSCPGLKINIFLSKNLEDEASKFSLYY